MALIRYPGSKEKLAEIIRSNFPLEISYRLFTWMDTNTWEYREPFFGAGAIGFRVLEQLPPSCLAWINDIDYGIVCLWESVRSDINRLCEKIKNFTPNVDNYNLFKEEDGKRDLDSLEVGFRKLALHQMSYSGLGFMSGGPLGGKEQDNDLYRIDCRWRSGTLINQATRLHQILSRVNLKITCKDFSELIDDDPNIYLYLDPPYYDKGAVLYKHSMSEKDHLRLARLLKPLSNHWILSYDDCIQIRELYDWAIFGSISVTYTINNGSNRKNQEVLISNHPLIHRGVKEPLAL